MSSTLGIPRSSSMDSFRSVDSLMDSKEGIDLARKGIESLRQYIDLPIEDNLKLLRETSLEIRDWAAYQPESSELHQVCTLLETYLSCLNGKEMPGFLLKLIVSFLDPNSTETVSSEQVAAYRNSAEALALQAHLAVGAKYTELCQPLFDQAGDLLTNEQASSFRALGFDIETLASINQFTADLICGSIDGVFPTLDPFILVARGKAAQLLTPGTDFFNFHKQELKAAMSPYSEETQHRKGYYDELKDYYLALQELNRLLCNETIERSALEECLVKVKHSIPATYRMVEAIAALEATPVAFSRLNGKRFVNPRAEEMGLVLDNINVLKLINFALASEHITDYAPYYELAKKTRQDLNDVLAYRPPQDEQVFTLLQMLHAAIKPLRDAAQAPGSRNRADYQEMAPLLDAMQAVTKLHTEREIDGYDLQTHLDCLNNGQYQPTIAEIPDIKALLMELHEHLPEGMAPAVASTSTSSALASTVDLSASQDRTFENPQHQFWQKAQSAIDLLVQCNDSFADSNVTQFDSLADKTHRARNELNEWCFAQNQDAADNSLGLELFPTNGDGISPALQAFRDEARAIRDNPTRERGVKEGFKALADTLQAVQSANQLLRSDRVERTRIYKAHNAIQNSLVLIELWTHAIDPHSPAIRLMNNLITLAGEYMKVCEKFCPELNPHYQVSAPTLDPLADSGRGVIEHPLLMRLLAEMSEKLENAPALSGEQRAELKGAYDLFNEAVIKKFPAVSTTAKHQCLILLLEYAMSDPAMEGLLREYTRETKLNAFAGDPQPDDEAIRAIFGEHLPLLSFYLQQWSTSRLINRETGYFPDDLPSPLRAVATETLTIALKEDFHPYKMKERIKALNIAGAIFEFSKMEIEMEPHLEILHGLFDQLAELEIEKTALEKELKSGQANATRKGEIQRELRAFYYRRRDLIKSSHGWGRSDNPIPCSEEEWVNTIERACPIGILRGVYTAERINDRLFKDAAQLVHQRFCEIVNIIEGGETAFFDSEPGYEFYRGMKIPEGLMWDIMTSGHWAISSNSSLFQHSIEHKRTYSTSITSDVNTAVSYANIERNGQSWVMTIVTPPGFAARCYAADSVHGAALQEYLPGGIPSSWIKCASRIIRGKVVEVLENPRFECPEGFAPTEILANGNQLNVASRDSGELIEGKRRPDLLILTRADGTTTTIINRSGPSSEPANAAWAAHRSNPNYFNHRTPLTDDPNGNLLVAVSPLFERWELQDDRRVVASTSTSAAGPSTSAAPLMPTTLTDRFHPNNFGLNNYDISHRGGYYVAKGTGRNPNMDLLAEEIKQLNGHIDTHVTFDLTTGTARFFDTFTGEELPDYQKIQVPRGAKHYSSCHQAENRSQILRHHINFKGFRDMPAYGAKGGGASYFIPDDRYVEEFDYDRDLLAYIGMFGTPSKNAEPQVLFTEGGQEYRRQDKYSNYMENLNTFFDSTTGLVSRDAKAILDVWKENRAQLMSFYFQEIVQKGGVLYCFCDAAQIVMLGLLEAVETLGDGTDLSKVTVIPILSNDPRPDGTNATVQTFRDCCDQLLAKTEEI